MLTKLISENEVHDVIRKAYSKWPYKQLYKPMIWNDNFYIYMRKSSEKSLIIPIILEKHEISSLFSGSSPAMVIHFSVDRSVSNINLWNMFPKRRGIFTSISLKPLTEMYKNCNFQNISAPFKDSGDDSFWKWVMKKISSSKS